MRHAETRRTSQSGRRYRQSQQVPSLTMAKNEGWRGGGGGAASMFLSSLRVSCCS